MWPKRARQTEVKERNNRAATHAAMDLRARNGGRYREVRHNYNFGESRGRSQVADERSIVEKGSA